MSCALVISAVLLASASSTFDGGGAGQRGAASLRLELVMPARVRSPERLALDDAPLMLSSRGPLVSTPRQARGNHERLAVRQAQGERVAPVDAGVAEPSPSTDRQRTLRRWERALKWSTAGALVATSALGTIAAVNQPTIFGDGQCQTGHAVLGTYGCDRGLSTLHGTSGVVAVTLYTANGVLGLAIPGPKGNVSKAERPWHRALTYVHLGGIVLQPLLGLVSAYPQMVGVRDTAPVDAFPKNLRTAHVFIGYITTAAFLTTLALEQ